jgi:hypothetical protein
VKLFALPLFGGLCATTILLAALAQADAPAGRYTISGDTVLDTKTRLTWQRSSAPAAMNYNDAAAYCAGRSQHLPSIRELESILDLARLNPAVDPSAFPATLATYYWTLTQYGTTASVWAVSFSSGGHDALDTATLCNVRCVR